MKIYFAGSIKGGREKQEQYKELIRYIGSFGQVLTEHVGNENVNIEVEEKFSLKEDEHVYIRDVKWIDECDVVVAEVSIPSLGVGYEIAYAESKNKEIICLYDNNSEKSLSYMLSGNSKLEIIRYNSLEEVKVILGNYLNTKNHLV